MAKPEYLSISRQNLENSNGQEPDYYDLCIDVMDGPVTTNNEVKVDISNPGNVTTKYEILIINIFSRQIFFTFVVIFFPPKLIVSIVTKPSQLEISTPPQGMIGYL